MVCQNNNKLTRHLLTLSTKQTNTNSSSNNTNNQPSHLRIGRSHLNSHSYLNPHSYLNSHGWGYYKSLVPTLTKLAIPSLIILSTIISTCTPILSTTIPSVNAVTANTNQATNQTTINNDSSSTSSTTNVDPSDPNYLNSVLEANGIDTSSTASNQADGSNGITTNDVDPTTMASDLESLNNALETQAEGEGISLSLSSNNQPVSTTNPATINIDPSTATGSGVTASTILAATSITSNVKTAMPGYSLSISTNTDNSNLTNTDSNLANTQNGSNILPTTGTQGSPISLTANTWGYAMKRDSNNQYTTKFDTTYTTGNTNSLTSKWAKVPTSQAPETIKHTEDTPQATGDNTTVYYAANIPKTKTAGNYQTTITYTATANVLDPPEVEKVSPDTIRQGMSMVSVDVPYTYIMDGGYVDASTSMCYLTESGLIYCSNTSTAAIMSLVPFWDGGGMHPSLNGGAYELIGAGEYGGTTLNWLKIDTSAFDGRVVQMSVVTKAGGTGGNVGDAVGCYLTDRGTVYCSNSIRSSATNAGASFSTVATYDNSSRTYVGAFTTEKAGEYDGHPYYWIKVDTGTFDSSSSSTGTTITLTGKNLSKVTNVYIDANNNGILDEGADASANNLTIISDTQLTFTAPSMSVGTYNIIVVNPGNVVVGGTLTYR